MTRDEARALADRVLALSKSADQTRVNITSTWSGNTRFADASITTSGGITDVIVEVTVTIGRKRASASTNVLDDAGLRRTVDLAAQLARLSPDDPELMPELGPQNHAVVNAYIEDTANLSPAARAGAVRRTIDGTGGGQIFSAGFLDVHAISVAVATSNGLFAFHRTTDADLSLTARTPDGTGSGWASAGSRDWGKIDPTALGRAAARKAESSRNPQPIDARPMTAILEPQATNDLVPLLSGALNARAADEGRSAFSKPGGNRIGEKVMDERVTLYSDPADPDLLAMPFDVEGLPLKRILWIDKGVLRNLSYTRFWAERQKMQPTGTSIYNGSSNVTGGGLKMTGGTRTTEELIAGCERGVLVTQFFYIRSLEPRTVLYTGLTRDGTFLIEKGKVVRPLKNLRWNESPLLMLNRLEDIGRPEAVAAGRYMPALRIRDFNFTSLSDAV